MHLRLFTIRLLIAVNTLYQEATAQAADPNVYVPLNKNSDWSNSNAHSHNDYQQRFPFSSAYAAGFGSMEADIFLFQDSLFVGHVEKDIFSGRTLQALYLDSIDFYLKKNKGVPYQKRSKRLQLLIDIKSEAISTIATLVAVLEKYPELIHSRNLSLVITGNRPPLSSWNDYPDFIYFDGEIGKEYDPALMPKIALFSGNLMDFTSWKGKTRIDSVSLGRLNQLIQTAHHHGKRVRFWNAPDFAEAWSVLIQMKVDWINTDHIVGLSEFLHNQ
jgi:alkaline phosphatase